MRPRPQWGLSLEEHYCVLLILMVLMNQSETKGGYHHYKKRICAKQKKSYRDLRVIFHGPAADTSR